MLGLSFFPFCNHKTNHNKSVLFITEKPNTLDTRHQFCIGGNDEMTFNWYLNWYYNNNDNSSDNKNPMKRTVLFFLVKVPVTQYVCLNMVNGFGANDSMLSTALKLRSQRTNDESRNEQNMKHRETHREIMVLGL